MSEQGCDQPEPRCADPMPIGMQQKEREIKSLLTWAQAELGAYSPSPQLDAEVLLSSVLDQDRAYLWTWPEKVITHAERMKFESLIEDRKKGVPVAYLLGVKEFWGLPLNVNKATLIPRPETELIVELVLSQAKRSEAYRIADLGTGSGAIALALAHELQNAAVVATDICWQALRVAKENAENLALDNIEFRNGMWCEPLEVSQYDFILSNPPYIDKSDPHLKQGDVRYEPRSALVSAAEGLADIEMIVKQTPHHLVSAGVLAMEHGADQGEAVRKLLVQRGFVQVNTESDLAGLERVTWGVWSGEA